MFTISFGEESSFQNEMPVPSWQEVQKGINDF